MTIRDGGNDSTGTPLRVEEATTAGRLKSLEKDGQMESQTRLYPCDHRSSAGTNSTETEVIAGLPDEILTKVQQIHKNPGGDNQLVRAEAEENITTKKSGTDERKTEQQRLEPGENTEQADSKRTNAPATQQETHKNKREELTIQKKQDAVRCIRRRAQSSNIDR